MHACIYVPFCLVEARKQQDIFLHKRELVGTAPNVGEDISFSARPPNYLLLTPPRSSSLLARSSLAPRSLLLAPRSWPARCPTQVEMDGQGQPTAKRAALAGGGPVAGGPAAGSSLYKGFALRRDFRVYKQIMGRQGRRSGNPLRNNVAPRASGVPGALGASSALPRFTGATERLLFVRRSSCRPRCFVRSTSSL